MQTEIIVKSIFAKVAKLGARHAAVRIYLCRFASNSFAFAYSGENLAKTARRS